MKKTNVHSRDKYLIESYPIAGVFENTDDRGVIEIMIHNRYKSFVGSWQKDDFDVIYDAIKAMDVAEAMEDHRNDQITLVPDKENMVSEDFTLKLMALVVNKEKIKEVK